MQCGWTRRGLPSTKIFTDLDQMRMEIFSEVHVLGKTLAYKVDQLKWFFGGIQ